MPLFMSTVRAGISKPLLSHGSCRHSIDTVGATSTEIFCRRYTLFAEILSDSFVLLPKYIYIYFFFMQEGLLGLFSCYILVYYTVRKAGSNTTLKWW